MEKTESTIIKRRGCSDILIGWLRHGWDLSSIQNILMDNTPGQILEKGFFHQHFRNRINYLIERVPNKGVEVRKYKALGQTLAPSAARLTVRGTSKRGSDGKRARRARPHRGAAA